MKKHTFKLIFGKTLAVFMAASVLGSNISYAASLTGSEEIVSLGAVDTELTETDSGNDDYEIIASDEDPVSDEAVITEISDEESQDADPGDEGSAVDKGDDSETETESGEAGETGETADEGGDTQDESESSAESLEEVTGEETEAGQIDPEEGIADDTESDHIAESETAAAEEVVEEEPESEPAEAESEAETEVEPETDATGDTVSIVYINPVYEGLVDENLPEEESGSGELSRLGEEIDRLGITYTKLDQAADYVRRHMRQRETTISFTLKEVPFISDELNNSTFRAFYDSFMELVYEETDDQREGDYLRYTVIKNSAEITGASVNNRKLTAVLSISDTVYNADSNQESAFTSAMRSAVSSLRLSGRSDYEKVILINQYIADHVTYDYEHLNDDSYVLKYSAYAALVQGTAVCQGYALLLYRMLRQAGVGCRIVSGIGNGDEHAWNIVEMDRTWYYMDPTWNDEKNYPNLWFLKGSSTFPNHSLEKRFDAAFLRQYPISETDYAVVADSIDSAVKQNGWFMESGGWRYYKNGSYFVREWAMMADEEPRYLDENGYMATNRIVIYNGNGYYVTQNGACAHGWFVLDSDNELYYADRETGALFFDRISRVGEDRYIFDNLGRAMHGFVKDGESSFYTINDQEDAALSADYFCGSSSDPDDSAYGCLHTGWLEYTGTLQTEDYAGFKHIRFYYDPETGRKISGRTVTIDGTDYTFDERGVLVHGIASGYTSAEASVSGADMVVTWDQAENAGLYYIYRHYTNMRADRLSMVTKCAEVDGELTSWTDPGATKSKGDYTYAVLTTDKAAAAVDFGRVEASDTVQVRFTDVGTTGTYYSAPVYWAAAGGITNGWAEDNYLTFRPQNVCTRAQIVTFLWRALGSPRPKSTKNPFKDVKSTDYYYRAVLWAVEKGITKGYSDGTFRPDDPCLREHAVTFQWRAAGKPEPSAKTIRNNKFRDIKSSDYYYKAVLWAAEKNITKGYADDGNTTFRPKNECLREHIVTFLYRQLK